MSTGSSRARRAEAVRAAARQIGEGVVLRSVSVVSTIVGVVAAAIVMPALATYGLGAATPAAAPLLGFAVVIAFLWGFFRWNRRAVLTNNRAQDALAEGDLGRAEAESLAVVRRALVPEQMLAYSLYRLGVVALRRRDWARATTFLRAASQIEWTRPFAAGGLGLLCAAEAALALACEGKVDEARTLLDEARSRHARERGAPPLGRAAAARSSALLDARQGRFAAALSTLGADRALLRNALAADDASLVDALEAVCLARSDDAVEVHPVAVDDESRAYVLAALPEAAPHLVAEIL